MHDHPADPPESAGRVLVMGVAVVLTGLAAGAVGTALTLFLHLVQHVAFGYTENTFLIGVERASSARRVLALASGGVVAGAGWWLRRRWVDNEAVSVTHALREPRPRLPVLATTADALVQIVAVGTGASMGREGAPRQGAAAAAGWIADRLSVGAGQQRRLLACGAGAGLAAVYNVPLGGALFALEVLLGTLALPLVLPALATSVIATAVAWITLGTAHTYAMPVYAVHAAQVIWALVLGPVIGLAAVGWVRVVARVAAIRLTGRARMIAPLLVLTALGLLAIPYPQLLGNGKGIVQLAIVGGLSLGLSVVLLVLKPIVTAACLGAGAPGGLFTPTLTAGVLLSVVLADLWSHVWPHVVPAGYALIGGGAFLAAAMQGPLSGVVLVLELTRHFDALMAPTLLAVCGATVVARRLGAPSIYSARLPATQPVAELAIQQLEADPDRREAWPLADDHRHRAHNDERAGRSAPDPSSAADGESP